MSSETVSSAVASLRRGLSHMLNRKLSAGWNAWSEMVAIKVEFMRLLRKGAGFMLNRGLAMGLARWRELVSEGSAMGKGLASS